jgi:hypothetical protein
MLVRAFELGFMDPYEAKKMVPLLCFLEKYFGIRTRFIWADEVWE